MTLTFCKIFQAVVLFESFNKAAEMLHMTPSAVSHSVADTERQIGFELFHRTRNGITLTECGKELAPMIFGLLKGEEALNQSVDQLRGLERGVAKIGIFNSTCTNWMPEIFERFNGQHPEIQIDIYEGGYNDVIRWIKNQEVDFGLLSTSCTTDLPVEPIYRDPLICLVPGDFKTKREGYITLEEMAGQQFVIQSAGSDADVQVLFNKYGLHFHSYCHVLDDTSIMAMVSCKRGISIMPTMTAKGLEGDLKVLKLFPEENRIIGLSALSKESLSPAAKALYDCIYEYAKGLPNHVNA